MLELPSTLLHERESWGVELHTRVLEGSCLPAGELLARGHEIEWRGSRLLLPSIGDQIAHTVLHATERIETWTTHGTQPVRRLIDLALLFERLSGDEAVPLAGSWRMNLCLAFAAVWLGFEPPAGLRGGWQQSLFRVHARLCLRPGATFLRRAIGRLLEAWRAPGRIRFLKPSRYVLALRKLCG